MINDSDKFLQYEQKVDGAKACKSYQKLMALFLILLEFWI